MGSISKSCEFRVTLLALLLAVLPLEVLADTPDNVDKAHYSQLKTGMTKSPVVKLLGREPDQSSDSEMMNIKTEMDVWVKPWSVNGITVTFQNGKVFSKTQTGLK